MKIPTAILATAFLAACSVGHEASKHMVSVDAQPANDMARIIFYRPSHSALALRDAQISVNGQSACALSNGDAYAYDVAPGTLAIKAKYWEDVLALRSTTVQADAGKTYFVRVAGAAGIPMSTWFVVTPLGSRDEASDLNLTAVAICRPQ
jgi:hypothetical protein